MPKKRPWTPQEEHYLQDHCEDMSIHEIAKALHRSLNAVRTRRTILGLTNQQSPWSEEDKAYFRQNRSLSNAELAGHLGRSVDEIAAMRTRTETGLKHPSWTPQEEDYLRENWGRIAIPTIAKKLGRTSGAVQNRARKLGLGSALQSGDYITFNQLMLHITGGAQSYTYQLESWVKKRGMPVHRRRIDHSRFLVVYLDEFWAWAEQHRSFIDFSKMEPLILGKEPAWVARQRQLDSAAHPLQRKDPWTPLEDQRLAYLLKQHKYNWAEISQELRRSVGAIQHRCVDLGLKERPVRESPHNPWSDEDLQRLADMIRQGYGYAMIGQACGGRSEKAVRGIVFTKYRTEDADKVRAMLGDGPWGTGAPEPTVQSDKHKQRVKKPIARLCELLLIRRNSMDFGEYWQKDMCQHWSDTRGCLKQCSDCDSCTEFQRIRPQYCRMCGGEFLERAEQAYCPKCRAMRKRQAQRKYAILKKQGKV